jgi:ketosteroid isomerase-like protein
MSQELSVIVAEHIRAVNAFDSEAIVATLADDAYVNDVQREIVGIEPIPRSVEKEIVGDRVTIEVQEVHDHYGDPIERMGNEVFGFRRALVTSHSKSSSVSPDIEVVVLKDGSMLRDSATQMQ